MSYNYDVLLKYILVGDCSTGKTSLLQRFITNQYLQTLEPTLAADFATKIEELGQTVVKMMIWDTAGQQTYKSLVRCYYKNCIIAVIVYDCTSKTTFRDLKNWVREVKEHCHDLVRIVIVGNKFDLKENIQVQTQEASIFANQCGAMFFEASAANGMNVKSVFIQPALRVISDLQNHRLQVSPNQDRFGYSFINSVAKQLLVVCLDLYREEQIWKLQVLIFYYPFGDKLVSLDKRNPF